MGVMRMIRRYRPALLALMLLLTQVAVASHLTAHFHPQLDQCPLCVSQAHPMAAIPPSQPILQALGEAQQALFVVPLSPQAQSEDRAYHQRAPPVPSP